MQVAVAVQKPATRVNRISAVLLALGLCAVPLSIAVTETLLSVSLLFRVVALARRETSLYVPRVFWFWLAWVALELLAWLRSPELRAGQGEIRHVLLIAAMFVLLPALDQAMLAWRGIFLASAVSSLFLIANFSFHERNGGLLHHWMIYSTVEILVIAGLLSFWHFYPEERKFWIPLAGITVAAVVLSLTRMLWVCSLLLLTVHLIWRRSRWIWAVPVIPLALFLVSPQAVRNRVAESSHLDYYSNAERLQMLRVGWEMVRDHPLTGVGPGRVEGLYRSYLRPSDPVPAYYGHLHNDAAQLAAQFGLPAVLAAVVFVAVLFRDLLRRLKSAADRRQRFLCSAALLGLTGFGAAGMVEYTYGHSLGLILLSFVLLTPLIPTAERETEAGQSDSADAGVRVAADRVLGSLLTLAASPVMIAAGAIVWALSRGRSPLVAHLRVGQHGRTFWVWKLRTMWPKEAPLAGERGWLQRIEADPEGDFKLKEDPRITSRFAAFCRKHSLDELPQLLHVVRGEMSLVGPRPVTRSELAKYYGRWANLTTSVKPGLTGYWQTQGRNSLPYPQRVVLDVQLVRHLSLRVYFRVLFDTIPEILSGKNAR